MNELGQTPVASTWRGRKTPCKDYKWERERRGSFKREMSTYFLQGLVSLARKSASDEGKLPREKELVGS